MSTQVPDDLKFTETDEWIRVDGEEALIGISDFAQDALSDIVFVELPKVGASFAAGEQFGVVESVKAAADLKMPVGGEVIAVNDVLEASPEKVNSSPYDDGWMIRIKPSDSAEMDKLMDAAAYTTFLKDR
ncbi:MAG: glycine cleavage system protein GcvH [Chloroflexi bacterium]|nr:glycine cleavage system protein GcvH [Chloroflexota bacterium]